MAYKLMAEYDNIFGAVTAREFPLRGNRYFCFKVKATDLRRMLVNMNADMEAAIFSIVYHDGARQDAYYAGQSGARITTACAGNAKRDSSAGSFPPGAAPAVLFKIFAYRRDVL